LKILRRWHPQTFRFGAETIALQLKALTKAEAVDFLRELASMGRMARAVDPLDEDAVVASFKRLQSDFVRDTYRRFVRLDEELGRDDGTRIEDAEQLLEELPTGLTFEILLALQSLCIANELQGKASGSPSTSSSGESGPGSGGIPAHSTGDVGGTEPSIAQPIPPGNGASSPLA
jgi:hypothetical protein